MNAYELSNKLENKDRLWSIDEKLMLNTCKMLRQQADRIAELEKDLEGCEYFLDKQQSAEPVAWIRSGDDQLSLVRGKDDGYMIWQPLYTTPQTKELSDAEISDISHRYHYTYNPDYVGFARAILKKAREK